jgi:hypothetical protein
MTSTSLNSDTKSLILIRPLVDQVYTLLSKTFLILSREGRERTFAALEPIEIVFKASLTPANAAADAGEALFEEYIRERKRPLF